MMATAKKPYPYTSFRFRLEIAGITVALVSEVTGLALETEVEAYEEGGVNDYVYQLPKKTKYQPLTFKRGITDAGDLWKWYQDVRSGTFERKDGAVILMDVTGEDKWRWNFSRAYPIKWTGPDFKAESSTIAFESVTLAHHGIKKG
jgi:phage tail-like protein